MKKFLVLFITLAFIIPAIPAMSSNVPIVFVHGFAGKTKTNFNTMMGWFSNSGWPSNYLHAYDYNSFNGVVNASAVLRDQVNLVKNNTRQPRVDIVAHSFGGLVTRHYLNHRGGTSNVRRVITLGTPHNGTAWAYTCGISQSCRDMWPGNQGKVGGCSIVRSYWSWGDEIIIPQTSARCNSNSWNTPFLGHLSLCWSWRVFTNMRSYFLQ